MTIISFNTVRLVSKLKEAEDFLTAIGEMEGADFCKEHVALIKGGNFKELDKLEEYFKEDGDFYADGLVTSDRVHPRPSIEEVMEINCTMLQIRDKVFDAITLVLEEVRGNG